MSKLFAFASLFLSLTLFSLTTANAQAPANDDCSGAVTLTVGTPQAGTVWNATATSGIPVGCALGNPDDDVWYKFTGVTTANISLSGIGSNLSASGAMIQLLSGTACGSFSSLSCANGAVGPLIITGLTAANTYYIRVYSYATGALASSGGSAFTITLQSTITPTNDDCLGAILIPTSAGLVPTTGWFAGATTSAGTPTCGAGTYNWDMWYKFVATSTNASISLTDIVPSNVNNTVSTNARLQLFGGSNCASLAPSTACTASSTQVLNAASLIVGNTYYVRVYSTSAGAFTSASNHRSFNINVSIPTPAVVDSTTALFNIDTVAKNLAYPWEITYGPDDSLWITEAKGYRVLRISSNRTQAKLGVAPQQILKLPLGGDGNTGPTFTRTIGTWPQGGMEGLAIHPEFATDPTKQWVYIAYVYAGTCGSNPGSGNPCIFRSKIVRCKFYYATDALNPTSLPHRDTLVILDTVISNLSGSNDHNSGRLKVGPTKEGSGPATYKLYYTIGDMGAGQFNNDLRTNNAQNTDTAEGKILRLNTEPDGDGVPGSPVHDYDKWRQWIPNDNPINHSIFTSVKTPIYSYGHRNAQGLAWGFVNSTWRLYSSEHGDMSGDEVNIIQSGKNYGWPKVTGVSDNNYTMYDDLTDGITQNDILANKTVYDETTFSSNTGNFTRPMFDFFNWSAQQIQSLNTGNIFTWPTIAPSSIEFYNGNIPGWKYSLLVTSLKYGVFRLKLNSTGDFVDSTSSPNLVDTFPLLHGWRIRDIAINPSANSGQFWAITDSSGSTSGPTGGFNGGNVGTANGGRVLRLTYKTTITSLPIHFLSFTGKLLPNKTIRLEWKAETDQAHDYFEVEKSTNNSDFTPIGKVYGEPPFYLIDPSPNLGNNYYRIKEVEFDRSPSYTKVIDVIYDPGAYIITAYPNPMNDKLNIKLSSPRAGNIQIQVSDLQGRIMFKQSKYMSSGLSDIQIDVKKWSSQLYSLQITDSENTVLTSQKIMKL